MKKKILMLCAVLIALTVSFSSAYANHGRHSAKGGDMDQMFFRKAHFLMEHQQELGLTPDRVDAIRKMKFDTKKMLIRQNAEIETVCLDIKAKFHDTPVDLEGINKLVDQKYELKKAKTKALLESFAKLKGMLTKEQIDQMRKLWGADRKEHGGWKGRG